MPDIWLPLAGYQPAPAAHAGYGSIIPAQIDPALRTGVTIHSAGGYFQQGNMPLDIMLARGNSWSVSILQSGKVIKHRLTPDWVDWATGGMAQNIGTLAIEMEGLAEPWTAEQRMSLLAVLEDTWRWFGWTQVRLGLMTTRTQDNIRGALGAIGPGSLWEHRWFDYTACPNGRNDWGWLIPALREALEGEEPDVTYDSKILDAVKGLVHGEFVTDGLIIFWVEKLGDVPELLRVDDSRASIIVAPVKVIPVGAAMYCYHGRQIT